MTTTTNRIGLYDDTKTIMIKMCEGNPGALTVLIDILKKNPTIDPDDAMGGFGPLITLDVAGIYGPSIWVLYKDTCGEDLVRMLAVLRAFQLGIITQEEISGASNRNGARRYSADAATFDVDSILAKVKAELPSFGK